MIVFNSKIGGDWGDEQRRDLEIHDYKNFEITVSVNVNVGRISHTYSMRL